MASPLNAVDLIDLVRRKVRDADNEIWDDDADILAYADEALEELFTTARLAGGEHLLETETWAPSDFTEMETDVWQIEAPEYVAAIRRIEVQGSDTNVSFSEVPQVELEERTSSRGPFSNLMPTWYRAGGERTIHIVGTLNNFPTIRYWYYRRWPPLHHGTSANVLGNRTVDFDLTPVGDVTQRDDLYNGMYLEILADEQLVKITDYDAASNQATVDTDLALVGSTQAYSLVSPLPPEHNSLLVNQTTMILLEDSGQSADLIIKSPRYQHLYERFRAAMDTRDHARPKQLYSRRAGMRR